MALVLDAGALIAFERGDRSVAALIEAARRRREPVTTSSGCVAQTWRNGARQALLARLLRGIREHELGPRVSRRVGELCGAAGTRDVVDAHLALVTNDGDLVLTEDEPDLRRLLQAAGIRATIRRC